jgi:hypothetical protein
MQSRRLSLGLAGAGVIVAVVLFIVLSDGGDSDSTTATTTTAQEDKGKPPADSANPGPEAARIRFANGAPVGGVRDIEVANGEQVRMEVASDVPAEVHVHGYELDEEVDAGGTAKLSFPATAQGEFEVEVHHLVDGEEEEGVEVATLTVTP